MLHTLAGDGRGCGQPWTMSRLASCRSACRTFSAHGAQRMRTVLGGGSLPTRERLVSREMPRPRDSPPGFRIHTFWHPSRPACAVADRTVKAVRVGCMGAQGQSLSPGAPPGGLHVSSAREVMRAQGVALQPWYAAHPC